jgi:uncharacterized protein YjbJ (UPF0337 family)
MGIDTKNIEGELDEAKGHVKEGVGALTGDRELQREGRVDQLKGKIEKGLGNLRQGAKDLLEKGKEKLDSLDKK